ncbi:MAG: HNH endonuclease signature motif containing protein [Chloroflexota bacterium]
MEDIKSEKGIRAYLLRTREYECENCELSEWLEEPIPLEVDHIDGNPDHNTEENLRLLCPNCHALTDNFKARARVNGKKGRYSRRRIQRRKRYEEGKSW